MANGTQKDIELRIRANDLGTQKLEDLVDLFERVRRSQQEFARSGDLSARSIRELKQEVRDLETLGRQLASRGSLIDLFEKQQVEVEQTSKKYLEARSALERYEQSLRGVEKVSQKQSSELSKLEKSFRQAEKTFDRATGSLETTRQKLAQLGLSDTKRAKRELVSFADQVSTSLRKGEQAIRDYDTRLREKRQAEEVSAKMSRDMAAAQRKVNDAVKQFRATQEFRELGIQAAEAARSTDVLSQDFDSLAASGRKAGDGLRAIIDPSRQALRTVDGLEQELAGLESQLRKAEGSEKLQQELREVRNELGQLTKEAARTATSLVDDIGAYRRQEQAVESLRSKFKQAQAAVVDYGMQISAADAPSDELSQSLRVAQDRLSGLTAQFQKESQSLANLRRRLQEAGVDTNDLASAEQRLEAVARRVVTSQQALGVSAVQLGRGARQADNALQGLSDRGRKALSVYQRIRGQVLALTSAYVGLFGVINLARRSIEAQQNRQAAQLQLLISNQSNVRAAGEDYEFLRAEAERLGFVFDDLVLAYSKISIAGKAAGFQTKQTREIFSNFLEVSRAFNLSQEETVGVFRALEQVLSKGKIQAEEIRNQLGDRLPGALQFLQKSLGVTSEELDKMFETGQISARRLLDFSREYADLVADQVPAASRTLRAEFNRLQTAINDFLNVLAEAGLADVVRDLAAAFEEFLESGDAVNAAKQIAAAFETVGRVILVLLENFDLLRASVIGLFAALSVRLIFNLLAGFGQLTAGIQGLRVALVTTTGAATGLRRAFTLLAGPAGILIGAATALIAWSDAADEAKQSTEEYLTELRALGKELKEQTDDQLQATLVAIKEQERAERERLKNLRRSASNLRRGLERGGTFEVGPGQVRVFQPFSTEQTEALQDQLERLEGDIDNAEARLREFYERSIQILDLLSSNRETPTEENAPETGTGGSELTDEQKRLLEQAAEFEKQVRQDLLESQEDNLEARLKLIDIEFDKRIARLRELQAALRKAGLEEQANQLGVQASFLESLRLYETVQERKKFLQEQQKRREKEITEEYQRQDQVLKTLVEQRQQAIEQVNLALERGEISQRQAIQQTAEIRKETTQAILDQIQQIQDYIASLDPKLAEKLGLLEASARLDALAFQISNFQTKGEIAANQLRNSFAQGAAESFGTFATGIADAIRGFGSFKDAILATKDAFRNFAADFLIRIGQMILQQAILNALQEGFGESFFSNAGNAIASGSVFHSGGVVNRAGAQRSVSPLLFQAAPRYHSGGIAGIRPNEVPAILQQGEEVLTRDDPRHSRNGAGGSGMGNLKIVNAIDSTSVVEEGLKSERGTRTVMNVIRANKTAVRNMLR